MVVPHFVYILLTSLSVRLTSNALETWPVSHIHDFSDFCYNGQIHTDYLTRGMGKSDTTTLIIANIPKLDCSFRFIVGDNNYIVVVIEFPDWLGKSSPCGNNNKVSVMVRSVGEINVCDELKNKKIDIFHTVQRNEINVTVLALDEFDTLKITATSLEEPKNQACDVNSDIVCSYKNHIYCMTNFVLCDGIVNCGVRDKLDEDRRVCLGFYRITPLMVFLGIITVLMTFVLLVAFLKNVLPARRGHFVFEEDETLSEKDRETSQRQVQVKLRVFFNPNEKTDSVRVSFEEELNANVFKRSSGSWKKVIKRSGAR